MTRKDHYNFSLIIPCYNESKNISRLFNEVKLLQTSFNFELLIVNNGSEDKTIFEIKKNIFKVKNYKIINIKKNIGFGNGIKKGLLNSTSDKVCYTHGDLQVSLKECIKAYNIFEKSKKNVYVKSIRINRSIIDYMFTFLMSLYNSIIFGELLVDIHAQPNFFRKPSKKVILSAPDDMSIDLFFFVFFKKKNIDFKRFKIFFKKRKFGEGNNDILKKKFCYSFYSLFKSFKVLKIINFLIK